MLASSILVAGAGVASLSSAAPIKHPSAHVAHPACRASGLVNWLVTTGQNSAGITYYELKFTNLSGHTCTISGYPRVAGVSLTSTQVGLPATNVSSPVHALAIDNRSSVKATIGIVSAAHFSVQSCHPVWAAGFRVYAPDQSIGKIIPFPFAACATHAYSLLRIFPVTF